MVPMLIYVVERYLCAETMIERLGGAHYHPLRALVYFLIGLSFFPVPACTMDH
jgi:hypothetical protein